LADTKIRESKGYASYAIWVALSILVIGLDQLTKWAIIKWVVLYDKWPVNTFINITHQQNKVAPSLSGCGASGVKARSFCRQDCHWFSAARSAT
jgi:hypothetical protein